MTQKNDDYVEIRRKQAKRLSIRFKLASLLPVNNKKIVFSTFEGDGGFCCNPRYIAEEIHNRDIDCKMIWLAHDITREFPEYVKVVKDTTWNKVLHLATAKIWVDNYRKPYGTLKRSEQIYIQTWHASLGFKAVGLYRGEQFPEIARLVSQWDSDMIDYMISNSEYCDRVYPKKLLFTKPTVRSGSPRVDCLINNRNTIYSEYRSEKGLEPEVKLAMFAPTFRGGNQKGKKQVVSAIPSIDFDRMIRSLQIRFGGEWRVLLRLHPQLSAQMSEMSVPHKDARFIDVSQEPDITQIMAACDVVVTDYSSCAFDAAFARIPVFLYADDVEEYVENRGKFMWAENDLPFPMSQCNDELMDNITNFDLDIYASNVRAFMNEHKIVEDGQASKRVVDIIENAISH